MEDTMGLVQQELRRAKAIREQRDAEARRRNTPIDYTATAKAHLGAGIYTDHDAQRVTAWALVSIAESLAALIGGAGGRAEDQTL